VSEQHPGQPPQGLPLPGNAGPRHGGDPGDPGRPRYGRAGWQAPDDPAGPAPGIAFAGRGARLVAYIVDSYLLGIPVVIIVSALLVLIGGDLATLLVLFWVVGLVALSAYFVIGWARGGQTLGMKMLGIRVVRDRDGGRVGWGAAIVRLIVFSFGLGVVLGVIWIFVDGRRRGWHDILAGTLVISVRR
jgi:uncharacterized RDD family membrane protein YckC